MQAYQNFDLLIEKSGEGYSVRVLESPAGRASSHFNLPFSSEQIEILLLKLGRPARGVRGWETPERALARDFGMKLFEAVFNRPVLDRLQASLSEVHRQNAGLRLRLRLSDVPELADLPWEFLFDPGQDSFLALSVETPVVRFIETPEPAAPLPISPPLNLLVMISAPANAAVLDAELEWQKLKDALGNLEHDQRVALHRLEGANLVALQHALRREKYHIFHFIGHGEFDSATQDGVLLLEDENQLARPVSGRDLGVILHDHPSLRLGVLNTCEGARASASNLFTGSAQSLVRQGLPAVIAMQYAISDQASITFTHEFYTALADGYPVDAALVEARKAILGTLHGVEWGTPVLYLSAPDGRIFDVGPQKAVPAPLDEAARLRLSRLYTSGLNALYRKEWSKAVESFQQLLDLQPGYRDSAQKLADARRQVLLIELDQQARVAEDRGDLPTASAAWEELLSLDPGNRQANARLARLRQRFAPKQAAEPVRTKSEAAQPEAVPGRTARVEKPTAKDDSGSSQPLTRPPQPEASTSTTARRSPSRISLPGGILLILLVLCGSGICISFRILQGLFTPEKTIESRLTMPPAAATSTNPVSLSPMPSPATSLLYQSGLIIYARRDENKKLSLFGFHPDGTAVELAGPFSDMRILDASPDHRFLALAVSESGRLYTSDTYTQFIGAMDPDQSENPLTVSLWVVPISANGSPVNIFPDAYLLQAFYTEDSLYFAVLHKPGEGYSREVTYYSSTLDGGSWGSFFTSTSLLPTPTPTPEATATPAP